MKIKVLIVEDEILVAEDLAADLNDMGFEVNDIAISGEECFTSYEKDQPDIILMDINIKGNLNGIEVTQQLKRKSSIPIIYLTSNTDSKTMAEAVKTHPHSFLSKPYNQKDLHAAIELAISKQNQIKLTSLNEVNPLQSSVFVKHGDFYVRIALKEILYIEAAGSYCTVFAEKGEYILSHNLQNFENKINHPNFIRIHRSYIVNVDKIDGFDTSSILINKKQLPISKTYHSEVFKYFQKI